MRAGTFHGHGRIPWWTTDIRLPWGEGGGSYVQKAVHQLVPGMLLLPMMRLHGNREPQKGFGEYMNIRESAVRFSADNEVYNFRKSLKYVKKYMFLRESSKPYIKEQMRITPLKKGRPSHAAAVYRFPGG